MVKTDKPGLKAFTLIELLVVIAIIGLLLAIIIPSLRMAKRKAQEVICRSNQRQWYLCYHLYAEANDDSFPTTPTGTRVSYMEALRDYYADINEMRTCGVASKPGTTPTGTGKGYWGSTFRAWRIFGNTLVDVSDDDWGIGSFAENYWIRPSTDSKAWGGKFSKTPSYVPLFGDGKWFNPMPRTGDPVPLPDPANGGISSLYNLSNGWGGINAYVMRRHKDGVNMMFVDGSVKVVQAEDLWTLNWHKDYDKRYDVDLSWMRE